MKSITRTLTISLSGAATLIFLAALSFVIVIDMAFDSSEAPCQAAVAVLSRATFVEDGGGLGMRRTGDLDELKSDSPDLWYVISFDGLMSEYGRDRRPSLPFALPYTGPIGLSLLNASEPKSPFCLDVVPRGGSKLVMIVGGARVGFRQTVKSFILRNLFTIAMLAVAFASTVAAGACLSAFIVGRSIDRVTAAALSIDPTAPHSAISLDDAPAELKPLLNALNRAFGAIDDYVQKQRRFLGNAAHQLRTPLTLMRTKIEDLPEPARADLVRDVRRLSSLVAAMLDLARLRADAIVKQPIDLCSLTRDVLADMSPSALDAGIELSLEQEEQGLVVVLGVEAAIRSALANLVSNALIHAHGATRIVAEVGYGSLSITDDGQGICETPGRKLTEPFQTGRPAMESAGLGLSIVEEIMAAHGGTLVITSTFGQGTRVCLCFPEASRSHHQLGS
jgi:signal transduction histidine kinase